VQNSIVGCTIAITDKLKTNFLDSFSNNEKYIDKLAMHDWFLALYAKYFGIILYSNKSNILYRQHDNNVSGIRKSNFFNKIKAQFTSRGIKKIDNYKHRIAKQAECFLGLFQSVIPPKDTFLFKLATRISNKSETFNWFLCLLFGLKFTNTYMNFSFLITPIIKPFIKNKK
jgi:rhamnosyltransferase